MTGPEIFYAATDPVFDTTDPAVLREAVLYAATTSRDARIAELLAANNREVERRRMHARRDARLTILVGAIRARLSTTGLPGGLADEIDAAMALLEDPAPQDFNEVYSAGKPVPVYGNMIILVGDSPTGLNPAGLSPEQDCEPPDFSDLPARIARVRGHVDNAWYQRRATQVLMGEAMARALAGGWTLADAALCSLGFTPQECETIGPVARREAQADHRALAAAIRAIAAALVMTAVAEATP